MSQVTDYTIPGSPLNMADLATSLENMFEAAASFNRGTVAPSNPFEGMLWWDSSANPEIIKRYTVAAGWVSILSINITTGIMSISGYVEDSLYLDNTILAANVANTPLALTVPEQRILGRKTGGSITALTPAEVSTMMGGSILPWATIGDVKASGTEGGNAVNGNNVRTIAVLTGSAGYAGWIQVSGGDVLYLSPGTYFFDVSAPVYLAKGHQLYLRNLDTSAIELVGTSEYSTSGAQSRSYLKGLVTAVSNQRLRFYHYTSDSQATYGLGKASGSGNNEVYTFGKIEKHS